MSAIDGSVPLWLSLAGFGLALTLRFEFMNEAFTRIVKIIELLVLAVIIYLCATMVWQF